MRLLTLFAAALVLTSCNQAPRATETTPAVASQPAPKLGQQTSGNAQPTSLPADPATMRAETARRERTLASALCDRLDDCHARAGESGFAAWSVIATVGPGGAVTAARVEGQNVSRKVRTCLTTTISGRRLAPEVHTPSEVTCEFSGGVGKGSRNMSGRTIFRRLDEGPAGGVPGARRDGGAR